ncbi:MAG: hypothetical protein Q8K72_08355, partial [Acidimicrobiales bacterium]|nr:hypothetical protein [Acidimicrobiales bacterium]
ALALVLSACGGDDDSTQSTADDTETTDETTADTVAGDDTDTDKVDVPEDICALVSGEAVGAVLGETVEARDVPGGGCQYAGGTAASLYPTITVAEDADGAGGIDGARAGAEGAVSGTAEDLTVQSHDGYVVTGAVMGSTSSQGALAVDGLIVTVSVAGGEAASNAAAITELLDLTVTALTG